MSQCHDVYDETRQVAAPLSVPAGAQCHDLVDPEDEIACTEMALAAAVREWAEQVAPGDGQTARVAVDSALYFLASGASVPEAFAGARERVECRLRHPSHLPLPTLAAVS